MKKSVMYELAALSVIKDNVIPDIQKLEVIGLLLENKQLEKYAEERKEKSNEH